MGANRAAADPVSPRDRVPMAVLWKAELRAGDVAVGADGHPVLLALDTNDVTKLDGSTGSVLWTVSMPASSSLAAIAVGPDGHPVVAMNSELNQFRVSRPRWQPRCDRHVHRGRDDG
jgi:hypothetical protein